MSRLLRAYLLLGLLTILFNLLNNWWYEWPQSRKEIVWSFLGWPVVWTLAGFTLIGHALRTYRNDLMLRLSLVML